MTTVYFRIAEMDSTDSPNIESIFSNIEQFELSTVDTLGTFIGKYEVIAHQLRNAARSLQAQEEQLKIQAAGYVQKNLKLEKNKQDFRKEQEEFNLLRSQTALLRCDRCRHQIFSDTVNGGFERMFEELRLHHEEDLGATPNTRFDITDSTGLRLWYSSYRKPAKSRPFSNNFRAPHIECFEDGFGYSLESEGLSLLIRLTAIRRKDDATGKNVSLPIWEVFSTTRDRWVPWMNPIFGSAPLNSKDIVDISCPRIVMPNDEEISRGVMWVLLLTEERFGISLTIGNPQLTK